jgi:hypothetical protein
MESNLREYGMRKVICQRPPARRHDTQHNGLCKISVMSSITNAECRLAQFWGPQKPMFLSNL